MNRRIWLVLALFVGLWGQLTFAQGSLGGLPSNPGQVPTNVVYGQQQGVIVRTNLGLAGLQTVCQQNGCTVVGNLDGNLNLVFLVEPSRPGLLPNILASTLELVTGILDAEVDQVVPLLPNPTGGALATNPPAGLW